MNANSQHQPYEGKYQYIYVSHTILDKYEALRLIKKLQDDGFNVWYRRGDPSDRGWNAEIEEKIKNCGYFLALVSENYYSSHGNSYELEYARKINKVRATINIDDSDTGGTMMFYLPSTTYSRMSITPTPIIMLERLYKDEVFLKCREPSYIAESDGESK